ncbi:Aste57867_17820 [Aphanomyces stellatus]|uniref:Aste57867_17820 protein n=1 Tax=Aphanomyces stellatus TaxID=120398 RepID=A0A485LA78_9STRA|nr:hypothetical protein As57867_017759 [Aphanomyces stellatus]VFT94563.1 Aste57867_17820 [Aphanomyces stellatus]
MRIDHSGNATNPSHLLSTETGVVGGDGAEDDDEPNDPNSLSSLLERVLQKVSQLPGGLEALSSDPQLLHDLQQHELLFYPAPPPIDDILLLRPSVQLSDALFSSEHDHEEEEDEGDDDASNDESIDLTSERFGSEYEAELLAVESLQRKSTSMDIQSKASGGVVSHPPRVSSSTSISHQMLPPESTSPSYSMGMLSMSPGASSQDDNPVSAVWPRQPNEFAFSQPDEGKEDELYNEVAYSEHGDNDDDLDKLFEMEDMESPTSSGARRDELLQDVDDDQVEYETMRLRIVRERNRTGFEPSQEFQPEPGALVGGQYQIERLLGEAVFSQTYKAIDTRTGAVVCLKVIRNSKEYFDQGIDEIRVLEYLNAAGDVDEHHVLRLLDYFYFKEHLILVTELLRDNLYEFSRLVRTQQGHSVMGSYFTMPRLKKIALECLGALDFLHALHIVHCDLKPENIVMKNYQTCQVKVIDFGSASFVTDELTYYIQSRSYRAPEVILGLRYDEAIDLWSLGCILAELYTGHVLFKNDSVSSLLAHIVGLCGNIPSAMLVASPEASKYFTADHDLYILRDDGTRAVVTPPRTSLWHVLNCADASFVEFLNGLLQTDPARRMSAAAALRHPWLESNVYGISDFSTS